jgi:hypothetical protein
LNIQSEIDTQPSPLPSLTLIDAEINKLQNEITNDKEPIIKREEEMPPTIETKSFYDNLNTISNNDTLKQEEEVEEIKIRVKRSDNDDLDSLINNIQLEAQEEEKRSSCKEEQLNELESSLNPLDDIIKQVTTAENQTEQLEKLDAVDDFTWQTLMTSTDQMSPVQSLMLSTSPTKSGNVSINLISTSPKTKEEEEELLLINDIIIPPTRDDDMSRLEVELTDADIGKQLSTESNQSNDDIIDVEATREFIGDFIKETINKCAEKGRYTSC